jgi:hypothetical protein
MDTTNNDGAFWIAGYTDYLRDVVGAADTTQLRYLPTVRRFIATCSGSGTADWSCLSVLRVTEFIREEAVHRSGHGRTAPASATRSLLAIPCLARCCSDRARPRHPEDPAGTACQPADAPLLGATRAVVAASSRAWSGGIQAAAVSAIVRRNLVRAGIPLGRLTGAHMLRHRRFPHGQRRRRLEGGR